ncbi:hypothetical protein V6N11_033864 [Hibiscus sabdariffa]|uniref:Uncharacterized protein n=1 Tax=Hibiscus sabdariffa TaxID=183260 RepID=A0ABR2S1N1_9ROSI
MAAILIFQTPTKPKIRLIQQQMKLNAQCLRPQKRPKKELTTKEDLGRKWKYVNWVIEKSFDEDIASELHDRTSHALSSMFASYVVVFDANDKGLDSSVTPMNLEVNATVINDMDDVQTMLEHQFERKIGYGGLEKDRVR